MLAEANFVDAGGGKLRHSDDQSGQLPVEEMVSREVDFKAGKSGSPSADRPRCALAA
jgi:hypothetical protein